ncbi:protease inhibitor I42 family protein [Plantactinospora siamensis]|uniref:Protease inhibitor I42 family protein n=1 Tax=Plantactinospora siamensis TaxID=555372 RepID=A0ABV6P2I5_9ACTN
MAELRLDRDAAGGIHRAAPEDIVLIVLPETPTSGYRWALDAYDPQVLRLDGDDYAAGDGTGRGGGGERRFRFAALSPGSTPVRLARRRDWAGSTGAERFETTVVVTGA